MSTHANYFYTETAEKFSFVKLPMELLRHPDLSVEAAVLYALMLDRMSLSVKNGWTDGLGRVYIMYTQAAAMKELKCGEDKIRQLYRSLEKAGLIERKRLGQGKPCIIYPLRFTQGTPASDGQFAPKSASKRTPENTGSALQNTPENVGSDPDFPQSQDPGKSVPNHTEYNQTNKSYNPPSIPPRAKAAHKRDDEELRSEFEFQIGCAELKARMTGTELKYLEQIVSLVTELKKYPRRTVRISGCSYPYQLVVERMSTLSQQDVAQAVKAVSQVSNINSPRLYLLSVLFNAAGASGSTGSTAQTAPHGKEHKGYAQPSAESIQRSAAFLDNLLASLNAAEGAAAGIPA